MTSTQRRRQKSRIKETDLAFCAAPPIWRTDLLLKNARALLRNKAELNMSCLVKFPSCYLLLVLLLLVSLHATTAADGKVAHHFLFQDFTSVGWNAAVSDIECLSSEGFWTQQQIGSSASTISISSITCCAHGFGCPQENTNIVWENPTCRHQLVDFSAKKFCKVMNGRDILVVGDSLQSEFYISLANHLLYERRQYCATCILNKWVNGKKNWTVDIPCDEYMLPSFKMYYVRNDRAAISPMTSREKKYGLSDYVCDYTWMSYLQNGDIGLLLINRGAHYALDEFVLSGLNETFTYVTQTYPNTSIVWRDTPPGHHNLTKRPLLTPEIYEVNHTWHYGEFAAQNRLVKSFLSDQFPQIVYIDVYTPTLLRADRHKDPLHYCLPGPVDTWVRLLYNAILVLHNHAYTK